MHTHADRKGVGRAVCMQEGDVWRACMHDDERWQGKMHVFSEKGEEG